MSIAVVIVLSLLGLLVVGDYVYRIGTSVYYGHHSYHDPNVPDRFFVPGRGQGPFEGIDWNRVSLQAYLTDRFVQTIKVIQTLWLVSSHRLTGGNH